MMRTSLIPVVRNRSLAPPPGPAPAKVRRHYNYPIISLDEILESCKDILGHDMCFSHDDFMKPVVEKIQLFYVMMLKSVPINFTPDRPPIGFHNVPGICSSPDIFEATLPKLTLFAVLKRIMIACRVDDFRFVDFTSPKKKTTIRMASAIINFILFTTGRIDSFNVIKTQSDDMRKEYKMLMKDNDEILLKINQIRTQLANNEPVVNEYSEKREELVKKLNDKSDEGSRVQKANQQLKTKNSEINAAINQIKVVSLAVKEDVESIRPRIIQSPEKFAGEMSRLKRHAQQHRSGRQQRTARVTELKTNFVRQDQAIRAYRARWDSLKMLANEFAKMSKIEERLQGLSDTERQHKDELVGLDAKSQQLKQALAVKLEKLNKLSIQVQRSQQAADNLNDDILREKLEIADHMKVNVCKVRERELALSQIESEMNDEKISYDKEEQAMNAHTTKLMKAVGQYHSNLATTWQPVENTLQAILDKDSALIDSLHTKQQTPLD